MKKVFVAFALLLLLAAGGASAQVDPYFQVFFPNPDLPDDPYFWQETVVCTPGENYTLYVAAKNLNAWVIGAEFIVNYPASVTFLGDISVGDLHIGDTSIGVSIVWAIQQSGFAPLMLSSSLYTCDSCPPDTPISVGANPFTGFLGYTNTLNQLVPVIGMVSYFCPETVPTEDTTWGQVKALFE